MNMLTLHLVQVALKITPAHDINDYNIGLKYNLPFIETLNEDGTLSEARRGICWS